MSKCWTDGVQFIQNKIEKNSTETERGQFQALF